MLAFLTLLACADSPTDTTGGGDTAPAAPINAVSVGGLVPIVQVINCEEFTASGGDVPTFATPDAPPVAVTYAQLTASGEGGWVSWLDSGPRDEDSVLKTDVFHSQCPAYSPQETTRAVLVWWTLAEDVPEG